MRRTSSRACVLCGPLYDKKYYDTHREKCVAKKARWIKNNPERHAAYLRSRLEEQCETVKRWARKNRTKINAYRRKLMQDPAFRLRVNLANRLAGAARSKGALKSARTVALVGCSIPELCAHLERQFLPGMTWDNYGYGTDKWHIDHIVPCSSFDLSDSSAQRACFHFSNLQPLWQTVNQKKGNRR